MYMYNRNKVYIVIAAIVCNNNMLLLATWCAEDEAAIENVEKTDETPTEALPPEDNAPISDAPPTEEAAPPPQDNVPVADSAPVETAEPSRDVGPVEVTAPAEHAAPSPEPAAHSSQKIEPVESPGEEAAPPTDTASAERVTEQASGPVDAVAMETDVAVEAEDDGTGLKPAPRIESGCRLDRDVLLASLMEVQSYLQQTDAQEQTDETYIGRLSEMVHVLNADMKNLRAYCERAQTQLESIRFPIKDITDKIFKTIAVTEEEGEPRKYKLL